MKTSQQLKNYLQTTLLQEVSELSFNSKPENVSTKCFDEQRYSNTSFYRDLTGSEMNRSELVSLYPHEFIRFWRDQCTCEHSTVFFHRFPDFIMRLVEDENRRKEGHEIYCALGNKPYEKFSYADSESNIYGRNGISVDEGQRTIVLSRHKEALQKTLLCANERIRQLLDRKKKRTLVDESGNFEVVSSLEFEDKPSLDNFVFPNINRTTPERNCDSKDTAMMHDDNYLKFIPNEEVNTFMLHCPCGNIESSQIEKDNEQKFEGGNVIASEINRRIDHDDIHSIHSNSEACDRATKHSNSKITKELKTSKGVTQLDEKKSFQFIIQSSISKRFGPLIGKDQTTITMRKYEGKLKIDKSIMSPPENQKIFKSNKCLNDQDLSDTISDLTTFGHTVQAPEWFNSCASCLSPASDPMNVTEITYHITEQSSSVDDHNDLNICKIENVDSEQKIDDKLHVDEQYLEENDRDGDEKKNERHLDDEKLHISYENDAKGGRCDQIILERRDEYHQEVCHRYEEKTGLEYRAREVPFMKHITSKEDIEKLPQASENSNEFQQDHDVSNSLQLTKILSPTVLVPTSPKEINQKGLPKPIQNHDTSASVAIE